MYPSWNLILFLHFPPVVLSFVLFSCGPCSLDESRLSPLYLFVFILFLVIEQIVCKCPWRATLELKYVLEESSESHSPDGCKNAILKHKEGTSGVSGAVNCGNIDGIECLEVDGQNLVQKKWHFKSSLEEYIEMANKQVKRGFISYVIRKMQIKTRRRYHYTLIKRIIIQNSDTKC